MILKDFNEKQIKIYHHFLELQKKYKKYPIDGKPIHKEVGLLFDKTSSIIFMPILEQYLNCGLTISDIKNDFLFYIEKDNVSSIETDITSFRGSDVFIIKYLFDGEVYDLIFVYPVRAILV